jgi:hypothetical protein
MMERQRPHEKVSLEDLIRLKRAEKPPQEFWSDFESELRRKQLAAIVGKRRWWFSVSLLNLARLSLPAAAIAVAALTLFVMREQHRLAPDAIGSVVTAETRTNHLPAVAPSIVADADVGGVQPTVLLSSVHSPSEVLTVMDGGSAESLSGGEPVAVVSQQSPITTVEDVEKEISLAQVILGIDAGHGDATPRSDSHGFLANLSEKRPDPESMASSTQFSEKNDPLAELAASLDARRARLLVSVDSREPDNLGDNPRVARTRDRIASRLDEQALSDSFRRLGLNGDSVSIKF